MSKHYVDLDQIIDHLEDEWGYEGMREELYEIPPADVVEIVRCKDCKHLVEIDDTNDLYVCEKIDIGMDGEPLFLSPQADFCSRAERKETE